MNSSVDMRLIVFFDNVFEMSFVQRNANHLEICGIRLSLLMLVAELRA